MRNRAVSGAPKLAFFGSSSFSLGALEALVRFGYTVSVVTQPDRPKGRGYTQQSTVVKEWAIDNNIPVFELDRWDNLVRWWQRNDTIPVCGIVASFGRILPKKILELPNRHILNIHPSLLPLYRGATPVPWTIYNGDTHTGVTIIQMDEQLDHGPIIAQQQTAVGPQETTPELRHRLFGIGTELLLQILPVWLNDTLPVSAQDEQRVSVTPLLTRNDGRINWQHSAEQIERQVRAFTPWPGTWTLWKRSGREFHVKLDKAVRTDEQTTEPSGTVLKSSAQLLRVACGDGHALGFSCVQLEGKKPMTTADFLRGYRDCINAILY